MTSTPTRLPPTPTSQPFLASPALPALAALLAGPPAAESVPRRPEDRALLAGLQGCLLVARLGLATDPVQRKILRDELRRNGTLQVPRADAPARLDACVADLAENSRPRRALARWRCRGGRLRSLCIPLAWLHRRDSTPTVAETVRLFLRALDSSLDLGADDRLAEATPVDWDRLAGFDGPSRSAPARPSLARSRLRSARDLARGPEWRWRESARESLAPAGRRGHGDGSDFQARRDAERDRFVINGVELEGASVGFDGLLLRVASLLAEGAREVEGRERGGTSEGEDSLTASSFVPLARRIVRLVNRTRSGGDALDAVLRLVAPPSLALLVPDSVAAPPLSIHIDVGAFPARPAPTSSSESIPCSFAHASGSEAAADKEGRGSERGRGCGDEDEAEEALMWMAGLRVRVEAETRFWVLVGNEHEDAWEDEADEDDGEGDGEGDDEDEEARMEGDEGEREAADGIPARRRPAPWDSTSPTHRPLLDRDLGRPVGYVRGIYRRAVGIPLPLASRATPADRDGAGVSRDLTAAEGSAPASSVTQSWVASARALARGAGGEVEAEAEDWVESDRGGAVELVWRSV